MSKTTPVKIALRRFVTEIGGERVVIEEGERVHSSHEVVHPHPEHFRTRPLEEELQIHSARVADLASRDFSAAAAPLSRAGRLERQEDEFWRSVDRELHRDTRSAEERTEDTFYEQALDQIEDLDAARARDESIEIGKLWYGRIGG